MVEDGPERPARWRSVLSPDRAGLVIEIARDVAVRLTSAERVENAVAAAARQTAFPRSVYWEPYAIAQGDAGLAVLFSYLDACFEDEGWDRVAHESLSKAALGVEEAAAVGPGLFSGLSGVALAGWTLSRDGSRYQHLLGTLDATLATEAAGLAGLLTESPSGVSVSTFDVISGLSGVGAYLLCRRDTPTARRALDGVLHALVALTAAHHADRLPAWFTPPHLLADSDMLRLYPEGNLNCGLAHGIPGPLALLALSTREGVAVEGTERAIDRIAQWLVDSRADDAWGVNWPTVVPVSNRAADPDRRCEPSRAAWCYGSPGVARALWLAGEAVGKPQLCRLAVEAMEAVYRRPIPERRIDSPTFCHGVAGLLEVTLRFASDTGEPRFGEAARVLTDQVVSLYEPDSLLGYRSFEPGGGRVDQPGLLDGAPGVAMSLLAAATDVEPSWDRLFLLS